MNQKGARKDKKPLSNKKKVAVNKMTKSPLLKLWRDTLNEVRIQNPKLSLKECMIKAKPIYQKAKTSLVKK